jgi:hypothetical protein
MTKIIRTVRKKYVSMKKKTLFFAEYELEHLLSI